MYHALIHKEKLSEDYINKFIELSPNVQKNTYIDINLLDLLLKYMDSYNYRIVEPNDLTVKFNKILISKKVNILTSTNRIKYESYLNIRNYIGRFILKIIRRFY